MKLTIDRDSFMKFTKRCDLKGGAVGNEALQAVALYATHVPDLPGGLDLKISNGLLGVGTMVACNTIVPGECAINCKTLLHGIGMMPSGALTLEVKGEKLALSSGHRHWSRPTYPLANLHTDVIPQPQGSEVRIPAREIVTMLERVMFAVADVNRTNGFRLGIYLDLDETSCNAIVVGEYMWVKYSWPRKIPGEPWSSLLSDVALGHARDLAEEEDAGSVSLSRDEHYLWIQNTSSVVVTTPPAIPFPDWRQVFGSLEPISICRIPRLATLETLKAAIAASSKPARAVWLRFLSEGFLRVDLYEDQSDVIFNDQVPVTELGDSRPTILLDASLFSDAVNASGLDSSFVCLPNGEGFGLTTTENFRWFCAPQVPPAGVTPPAIVGASAPAPGAQPATTPPADEKPSRKRSPQKP